MVGVRHEKTAPYAAGDVLDVIVGEPVHGGWCVARPGAPEAAAQPGGPGNPGQAGRGPVLFIRHTLPGERVKAVITQTTAKFARAESRSSRPRRAGSARRAPMHGRAAAADATGSMPARPCSARSRPR